MAMISNHHAGHSMQPQNSMRILMLGWEFPPYVTGGLGAACEGLVKGLVAAGHDVKFLLPVAPGRETPTADPQVDHVHEIRLPATTTSSQAAGTFNAAVAAGATPEHGTHSSSPRPDHHGHLDLQPVPSGFSNPYARPTAPASSDSLNHADNQFDTESGDTRVSLLQPHHNEQYQGDLLAETSHYASRCLESLANLDATFDIVHAHDWMTFPAARALAERLGVSLILHVHSLERDRCPSHPDPRIERVEREALHAADHIITVSNRTREMLVHAYALKSEKVSVVYNGIDFTPRASRTTVRSKPLAKNKTVLFLGRMTEQKGVNYLLDAAERVITRDSHIRFVFAGSGDALPSLINQAAQMKTSRVLFTGHLEKHQVERALQNADLLVVPSVSEPFGLVVLEAVRNGLPVIMSTTTGAGEVIHHSLKVDYWNVPAMADRILAVLNRPALANTLRARATAELAALSWAEAAAKCISVYQSQIRPGSTTN